MGKGDNPEIRTLRVTGSQRRPLLPYPHEQEYLFYVGDKDFHYKHKLHIVEAIRPEKGRQCVTVRTISFQPEFAISEESFLVRRLFHGLAVGMEVCVLPKPNGGVKIASEEYRKIELRDLRRTPCKTTLEEMAYVGSLDPNEFCVKHPRGKTTRNVVSKGFDDWLDDEVTIRATTYEPISANGKPWVRVWSQLETGFVRHHEHLEYGHVRLTTGNRNYLYQ